MNFQNLEYFVTVVNEGNITRASRRLNISQQALSNHISRLEEELNCKLFDRSHDLELTMAGQEFLKSAKQIIDIRQQTETVLDDINHNRRGLLKIGIAHTRGQAILPLLLPSFNEKYPLIDLKVVEDSTRHLEESLQKGQIDVLIGFSPSLECAQSAPLMKERLFLIIPNSLLSKQFPEHEEETVQLFEKTSDLTIFKDCPFVLLKEGDWIRQRVDRRLRQCKMKPEIILETTNTQTAFALSSLGMGLTVCPELYLKNPYIVSGDAKSEIRSRVRTCLFSSGDDWDTISISYNKDRYLSTIAKNFITFSLGVFSSHNHL